MNTNTKEKTILVTGGAGFIGSNFCYYMLNKYPNYLIICLDMLTYAGNLATLEDALENKMFIFEKGSITDENFVNSLFYKYSFDFVVHFAAESHVDKSIEDPYPFLVTNIIGTHILMEAARKHGNIRFHQVSTDEVYGDLPLDRPELKFSETSPLRASNPYSSSKASADLLALAYFRTYDFPVTISRCSNNYGPYQHPEKLIPRMFMLASVNQPLTVHGNGANVRDWLYVEDHCYAIDLIIHKGKPGEIYNIGGHSERSNLTIIKTILNELGKPESLITHVADRKGNDLRYAIDTSKIEKELGWSPQVSFDDGIKKTIKWYINNKKWLKSVCYSSDCNTNNRIAL